MKLVLIFLLSFFILNCNELDNLKYTKGSKVEFGSLTKDDINDLVLLGKVWGFLKYHHPAVASGKYNWDYELFKILPDFLEAGNTSSRNELLSNWISDLGNIPACNQCYESSKFSFLLPDHSWFNASNVSNKLSKSLHFIYSNRNQKEHNYVKPVPNIGNPEFLNEDAYKGFQYPDAGYRLLALYRYWNIIEYFFPYKYLNIGNWNDVLKTYISEFVYAKDELQYEMTVVKLLGEVHDSHAQLNFADKLDDYLGNNFAPIKLKYVEGQIVVYQLEKGFVHSLSLCDVITHINGRPIIDIISERKVLSPGSNEAMRMRMICSNLLRSKTNELIITLNDKTTKKVKLFNWVDYDKKRIINSERSFKILKGNVGYVTLESITDEDVIEIIERFKNTKGIVMDIRNYPSEFVPYSLGSYFINKNSPFVSITNFVLNTPGEFRFVQKLSITMGLEEYKGKLVVLVNEETQSQAEFTAMAFSAGQNTTIVGSTTAGADGDVSLIKLPGGLSTWMTGIGVYYPDSTETQRIGIIPDVYLEPTIKGIKQNRDELLEKAVSIIINE
jgi:C-terminal processing protease CtpA/Prc